MTSFLFRTDVHVMDRSPDSWKGDYEQEVFSNLEQIGRIAREREVTAILDGGDFFHVKAASRNSHALVRHVIDVHKAYPCPVYSIEGNHDLQYHNMGTLERQPLGVLYAAGIFHPLRDETFCSGNHSVRVVGIPYSPSRSLADLQAVSKDSETHLVCLVHALATMGRRRSADGFVGESIFDYADLVSNHSPDLWAFGHWHKDQGVSSLLDTSGRSVSFVNQGAVSRGALSSDNLDRTPKVAIFSFEDDNPEPSVELIELEVAPSHEVFDLEKKSRQEVRDEAIGRFVTDLVNEGALEAGRSVEETLNKLDFARDVREGAVEYLERARSIRGR